MTRKEDWFPERPQEAVSFCIDTDQRGRLLDWLSLHREAKHVGVDPKQTPKANPIGELHEHWMVRGQSFFLHTVPVWSQPEPRELVIRVDLNIKTAKRSIKRFW